MLFSEFKIITVCKIEPETAREREKVRKVKSGVSQECRLISLPGISEPIFMAKHPIVVKTHFTKNNLLVVKEEKSGDRQSPYGFILCEP